ncbi:MAG: hypothetical protein AAFQ68_20455 [Bacteroidota bacterium]
MDFIEYTNTWAKSEVTQGRIMIGIGILLLVALYGIFRSQNELLKGALIPLSLLTLVLIGYGSYILYSRPAHARDSIALYQSTETEAIVKEKEKHINDNKAGKRLIKFVYPSIILLSVIAIFLLSSPYYRGMALGFILLAVSTYIIDYGFVSRSDAFIAFLDAMR